jgi:isopentenyl diphosphate isomerase/L-lactate dehydrogenase-like FMN-dependent dehydrogenase
MPLFCSPTALQRLFHHDGERAVAKAAEKFGTMFSFCPMTVEAVDGAHLDAVHKLTAHAVTMTM